MLPITGATTWRLSSAILPNKGSSQPANQVQRYDGEITGNYRHQSYMHGDTVEFLTHKGLGQTANQGTVIIRHKDMTAMVIHR